MPNLEIIYLKVYMKRYGRGCKPRPAMWKSICRILSADGLRDTEEKGLGYPFDTDWFSS